MPAFSHKDACMIQAETTLWNCVEVINGIEQSGEWYDRIKNVRRLLCEIAAEMRTYNEQFETEDD